MFRWYARRYSYPSEMPMTARKESAKTKREDMCHRRKTIQVSSIWVFLCTSRRGHDRGQGGEQPESEGGNGIVRTRACAFYRLDPCPCRRGRDPLLSCAVVGSKTSCETGCLRLGCYWSL